MGHMWSTPGIEGWPCPFNLGCYCSNIDTTIAIAAVGMPDLRAVFLKSWQGIPQGNCSRLETDSCYKNGKDDKGIVELGVCIVVISSQRYFVGFRNTASSSRKQRRWLQGGKHPTGNSASGAVKVRTQILGLAAPEFCPIYEQNCWVPAKADRIIELEHAIQAV